MKQYCAGRHPSRMRLVAAAVCLVAVAFAGENGVAPRRSAAEYPVSQSAKSGVGLGSIGAAIVPPDVVKKIFSSDVARDFIVVEVAMYPADNGSFEADRFDFGLKLGDRVAHAESAGEVAMPGSTANPDLRGPDPKINVQHETGVVYSRTNDPYYGRRTNVGVYEGTTVSNAPPPPAAKTPASVDPRVTEEKLRDRALPDGPTTKAVAGYLYFPASKRKKGEAMELQYTKGDVELDLKFPAK
jgi:hypothetical protein